MAKRSKYDTVEIKGGVLEQERIARRIKKVSDRREKRDKFINKSFDKLGQSDQTFIQKMS